MKLSCTCCGKYKGQQFKIVSERNCQDKKSSYGSQVEIEGVKYQLHLNDQDHLLENVEDAIIEAKRFIDSFLPKKEYLN